MQVVGRGLAIVWEDGHESFYPFDDLRKSCPCARCRTERQSTAAANPLRIVRAARLGEAAVRRIRPVGAYAVQLEWSDGHDLGIYSFDSLRRTCPCEACRPASGSPVKD
jgi:DUF971 family protein